MHACPGILHFLLHSGCFAAYISGELFRDLEHFCSGKSCFALTAKEFQAIFLLFETRAFFTRAKVKAGETRCQACALLSMDTTDVRYV